MPTKRALLIGAVETTRIAFEAIARHPAWDMAAIVTLDHRLARVVLGHPPAGRRDGESDQFVVRRRLEDARTEVPRPGLRRDGRRHVQDRDRRDPVKPEQPLGFRAPAPPLEVKPPVGERQEVPSQAPAVAPALVTDR